MKKILLVLLACSITSNMVAMQAGPAAMIQLIYADLKKDAEADDRPSILANTNLIIALNSDPSYTVQNKQAFTKLRELELVNDFGQVPSTVRSALAGILQVD